jgi:PBP1b-binding outer membrane lipoprotein LpoB
MKYFTLVLVTLFAFLATGCDKKEMSANTTETVSLETPSVPTTPSIEIIKTEMNIDAMTPEEKVEYFEKKAQEVMLKLETEEK